MVAMSIYKLKASSEDASKGTSPTTTTPHTPTHTPTPSVTKMNPDDGFSNQNSGGVSDSRHLAQQQQPQQQQGFESHDERSRRIIAMAHQHHMLASQTGGTSAGNHNVGAVFGDPIGGGMHMPQQGVPGSFTTSSGQIGFEERQRQLLKEQEMLEQQQQQLEYERQKLLAGGYNNNAPPSANMPSNMMHPQPLQQQYPVGMPSEGQMMGGMGGGMNYVNNMSLLQGQYQHPHHGIMNQGQMMQQHQHQQQQQPQPQQEQQHHYQQQHQGLGTYHQHPSHQDYPQEVSADNHQQEQIEPRQDKKWWVCRICETKAFASEPEAIDHEKTCADPKSTAGFERHQYQQIQNFQEHSTQHHQQMLQQEQLEYQNSAPGVGKVRAQPSSHPQQNVQQAPAPSTISVSGPIALALPSDKDWITPLHCFVRRQCVEFFCATEEDVSTPAKGKRRRIHVGQVGIRCPHCHATDEEGSELQKNQRERGSIYYPNSISSIYNATMNLLQRHLHACPCVPEDIMIRYGELKADDARSGTSKKYWVNSAMSLGLIDTPQGIRFSGQRPPPLPLLSRQQDCTAIGSASKRNSLDFFSTESNAMYTMNSDGTSHNNLKPEDLSNAEPADAGVEKSSFPSSAQIISHSAPLVVLEDKSYATGFSYHLLSQMQSCVFTEADRLGKRKGLPPGFTGLACRHCFGAYGSGRFFPSSIKTLSDTSKTLNVLHSHMQRCRKCPPEVRTLLDKLRLTHDVERAKMKFGSQKAFFGKIWRRLHESSGTPPSNASASAPPTLYMAPSSGIPGASTAGYKREYNASRPAEINQAIAAMQDGNYNNGANKRFRSNHAA